MLLDLLFAVWRRLSGPLQWWLLWLVSSKFMVSVSGVVQDDAGQVLLQRHRHWVVDVWGLPGGIVRRGETLENAFKREVREETGLDLSAVQLLDVVSGYHLRLEAYFRAGLAQGGTSPALRLQTAEVLEARFFPLEQLPPNLLPAQRSLLESLPPVKEKP